jgi:hypothetical protein
MVARVIGLYLAAVFCLLLATPTQSAAKGTSELVSFSKDRMQNAQNKLALDENVLKGKQQSEWTDKEIESYLFHALFSIYHAMNAYMFANRRIPSSWESLRDLGDLTPWPGNPLNNWEPIKWSVAPAEFKPGDLVLQICPPDYYSGLKNPVPLSFELSINGPTEDYSPIDPFWYVPAEWAVIPKGTAFIAGATTRSPKKTLELREKREKAEKE